MGRTLSIDLRRIRPDAIREAAAVVRKGGVILYPTDTIYGLGCNALSTAATARIFRIKGRPEQKSSLVLVRSVPMVRELVSDMPDAARLLMRRFWPGPLTMVFSARRRLSPYVIAADGGIAIRIPRNRFCLGLIRETGRPIVSTSANISGKPEPAGTEELKALFRRKVDLVIDAGVLPRSLPSTVIDVREGEPRILRPGAIPEEDIFGALDGAD